MIVRHSPQGNLGIGRKAEKKQLLNKVSCQMCSSGMLTCRNSSWVFGENTASLVQHTAFASVQGSAAFVIELTGHRQGSIIGLSHQPVSLAHVPADHVQGQVLLPDLLRLPPLGELPAAAAEDTP